MSLLTSAIRGSLTGPRPPWSRGVRTHCRCVNFESVLTATTFVLMAAKSSTAFENATISVGHTNVKSKG